MKKQGFTLIELMVVIVIMGILAAVAVPKLFGMIAKSKASEVGPAAGTYVKLQQAYVSEAANIGNWEMVGYAAPGGTAGTTNFEYKEPATASWTNKTVELSAGMTNAWVAHNKTKLNECAQGDNWTVSVEEATGSAAGEAKFTAFVTSTTGADCSALTPNFTAIGK